MQLFFREFPADYGKYQFPYQVLLRQDRDDDLARIYLSGFLPFRSQKDWYYLARSTRVKLGKFELSSENRRILKKMEGVTYTVQPVEQFVYDAGVQKLCAKFSASLGGKPISTAAIRKLFTGKANANAVMTFRQKEMNVIVGYVALVAHENFVHYAHPFVNVEIEDKNLNIGMMTMAIDWAKNQRKQFVFLGTCYTPGSLYKTQFEEFEYFDGVGWNGNLEMLKELVQVSGSYDVEFDYDSLWQNSELIGARMKFK